MKILKPIADRRSVRHYKNIPVEDEKIMSMIESARLAPSGDNSQPWHFIIVKSEAMRTRVTEVCHKQKWMMQAPVHIVCVADIGARLRDLKKKDKTIKSTCHLDLQEQSPYHELKLIIRDTAIAVDHLVLQAASLGLGTCWIAWFEQNKLRPVLGIPADKYILAVICVGYAAESPKPRPRKRLTDMLHYERWGEKLP